MPPNNPNSSPLTTPPPTTPITPPPTMPVMSVPKSGSGLSKFIIALIILLVLAGSAGATYYYWPQINDALNLNIGDKPPYDPAHLISEMSAKQATVNPSPKTGSYSLALAIKNAPLSPNTKILKSSQTSGSVSGLSSQVPADLDFKLDLSGTWANSDVATDLTVDTKISDMTFQLAGQIVTKDGITYAKATKLGGLSMFVPIDIKDQWIKFSTDDLKLVESASTKTNDLKNLDKYKQLGKEIAQVLEDSAVVQSAKPVKEKATNGESLYRYDLTISKPGLVAFLKKLAAMPDFQSTLSLEKINALTQDQSFNDAFDTLGANSSLSLWVNAEGVLNRILLKSIIATDTMPNQQLELMVDTKYGRPTEPVKINVPTEFKTIGELMSLTIASTTKATSSKSKLPVPR